MNKHEEHDLWRGHQLQQTLLQFSYLGNHFLYKSSAEMCCRDKSRRVDKISKPKMISVLGISLVEPTLLMQEGEWEQRVRDGDGDWLAQSTDRWNKHKAEGAKCQMMFKDHWESHLSLMILPLKRLHRRCVVSCAAVVPSRSYSSFSQTVFTLSRSPR